MSLQTRIEQLAAAIATDIRALQVGQGNLQNLTTAEKSSLVGALNELKSGLEEVIISGGGVDDSAGPDSTTASWSASKITATINAAITALINSAPAALDTLGEIATAINDGTSGLGALMTAVGHKVDYNSPQTLTSTHQAQACANIGIGDPETDFAQYYAAQKDAL